MWARTCRRVDTIRHERIGIKLWHRAPLCGNWIYQLRNLYAKACSPSHHRGISFVCIQRTRSGIKWTYIVLVPSMRNKQGARRSLTYTYYTHTQYLFGSRPPLASNIVFCTASKIQNTDPNIIRRPTIRSVVCKYDSRLRIERSV